MNNMFCSWVLVLDSPGSTEQCGQLFLTHAEDWYG